MERDIEKMIEENKKLVWYTINLHYKDLVADDDIYQCGLIGLWRACETFDESKGHKFSTYAVTCINNEISIELRARYRKNRLPVISLDAPLDSDDPENDLVLADTIKDRAEEYSPIECDLSVLKGKVPDRYIEIMELYANGYNLAEISRMKSHPRIWGTHNIRRARTLIQKYFKKEDLI